MLPIKELLVNARKLNNWADDATGGGLWTANTTFQVDVPVGKRWFVLGGIIFRSDSSTVSVRAYNAADKIILSLDTQGAATGITNWPGNVNTSAVFTGAMPFPLDTGEYVLMTFGSAQGATAYASCTVLEIDI